jgi:hypothetical protein
MAKYVPKEVTKATIEQSESDTPGTVEDKVRALPANQGLNEIDMWAKIDAEIKQSRKDGMLQDIEDYTPANKHQV